MASTFWKTVLLFDESKIATDIALRNAIGITLPLVFGAAAHNIPAGVVASLGALNVCYSDSRDPYAERTRRMVRASILVGLAVTTGALSAHDHVIAVLAASLWAFAIGMMVVLGNKAADLGAVTLVTLIVFAARSLSVPEALWSGLLAVGGGLLQTLLSIALWPVRPYQPEREVIAALFRSLAEAAILPAGNQASPPATSTVMNAQESLASLSQNRSLEAERLMFLFAQAERIRLTVLTLRRLARRIARDPQGQDAAQALTRVLVATAAALESIADRTEQGQTQIPLAWVMQTIDEFRGTKWPSPTAMFTALVRDSDYHLEALAGQLRAAARQPGPHPVITVRETPEITRIIARLKANLTLESAAFRHAIRLAVCVGLGDAIGRSISLRRTYWLPMTVAIVLKPDFASTFARGIQRISGTMAGLLLATGVFYVFHTGLTTDIAFVAIFAFFGRWIGPANYALFVSALSAIVVLLIALGGDEPGNAIVARFLNTTLGGTLALGAYWLWPTWERTRTGPAIGDMLKAYLNYFRAVISVYQGGSPESLDSQRLPGRLARSNAEASVGRVSAEPGTQDAQIHMLNAILVTSHALVRSIMALESAVTQNTKPAPNPAVLAFAASAEEVLQALADAANTGKPVRSGLPDLRTQWKPIDLSEPHTLVNMETDRITTSLNTLREQLAKWQKLR